mmetsp:Transcript_9126/g.22671  ORF Transcript_9126/g.22671 Transcript_9126/m.22671 type:complete len:282 (-) Transcript_9126:523-1368(-)
MSRSANWPVAWSYLTEALRSDNSSEDQDMVSTWVLSVSTSPRRPVKSPRYALTALTAESASAPTATSSSLFFFSRFDSSLKAFAHCGPSPLTSSTGACAEGPLRASISVASSSSLRPSPVTYSAIRSLQLLQFETDPYFSRCSRRVAPLFLKKPMVAISALWKSSLSICSVFRTWSIPSCSTLFSTAASASAFACFAAVNFPCAPNNAASANLKALCASAACCVASATFFSASAFSPSACCHPSSALSAACFFSAAVLADSPEKTRSQKPAWLASFSACFA